VKDRSLGGRMVFVPAKSSVASPREGEGIPSSGRLEATSPSAAASKPTWWRYDAFPGPEDASQQAVAQRLLGILQDAKTFYGRDVNVSDLVELKRLCHQHNLRVRPKTANDRDTMFRTAVQGCLAEIDRSGSGALVGGTDEAGDFLTGLAVCTGLPWERAGEIAAGEVAAKMRAGLLQAAVALRVGRDIEVDLTLIQMDNVLKSFPFDDHAPEVDVIARSLSKSLSDDDRGSILARFPREQEKNVNTLKAMIGQDRTVG